MSIHFDKKTKTFYLEGKSTTYAFYINKVGYAEHLYTTVFTDADSFYQALRL